MLTIDIQHSTGEVEVKHYPYANSSTFPLLLDEYGFGYWWNYVEMTRHSTIQSKLVDLLPDPSFALKT